MRAPVFLGLLHKSHVRRVAAAAFVSSLGDWVNYGAVIALITFGHHDGVTQLAILAVVSVVPTVLLSPLAGALADRIPLRRTMVACDLARTAVVLGFVLAPNLAVLLALIGLREAFATLFTPAQQAYVALSVESEDQVGVVALNQTGLQLTKIVGPALGGLLYAVAGSRLAFGLDAGSFALSAVFLLGLPKLTAGRQSGSGGEAEIGTVQAAPVGMLAEIGEGVRFVARTPVLATVITAFTLSTFVIVAYDTLTPLALRSLGFAASSFGLVVGAIGIGAVLGSVALGQFAARVPPFLLLAAGNAMVGLCVAGLGTGVLVSAHCSTLVWMAVALVLGVASAGIIISFPVILQGATPPELIGRVIATAQGLTTIPQILAPVVGAAVAVGTGVGGVLTISGAALVAIGVTLAVGPHRRWSFVGNSAGDEPAAESPTPTPGRIGPPALIREALSEAQRQIVDSLSDEEMNLLDQVSRRLQESEPDLLVHGDIAGSLLF
jgi:MFS family permease